MDGCEDKITPVFLLFTSIIVTPLKPPSSHCIALSLNNLAIQSAIPYSPNAPQQIIRSGSISSICSFNKDLFLSKIAFNFFQSLSLSSEISFDTLIYPT